MEKATGKEDGPTRGAARILFLIVPVSLVAFLIGAFLMSFGGSVEIRCRGSCSVNGSDALPPFIPLLLATGGAFVVRKRAACGVPWALGGAAVVALLLVFAAEGLLATSYLLRHSDVDVIVNGVDQRVATVTNAILVILLGLGELAGVFLATLPPAAVRPAPGGPGPSIAPWAPGPSAQRRYECPRCGRAYWLRALPPGGSLCPSCRKEAAASWSGLA